MTAVTTTYLQMTDRAQLRPKACADPRFRILEATVRQWQFNRFLYQLVGAEWEWHDRLCWTDEQWQAYVEDEGILTFVAYYDGAPAGYFELANREQEVEIVYFGLVPAFIGKGLGGVLLTRTIQEAWQRTPNRVWVHTCTLDHPAALGNYQARGMVLYRTETSPP